MVVGGGLADGSVLRHTLGGSAAGARRSSSSCRVLRVSDLPRARIVSAYRLITRLPRRIVLRTVGPRRYGRCGDVRYAELSVTVAPGQHLTLRQQVAQQDRSVFWHTARDGAWRNFGLAGACQLVPAALINDWRIGFRCPVGHRRGSSGAAGHGRSRGHAAARRVYFLASNTQTGFASAHASRRPVYEMRPSRLAPEGINPPFAVGLRSWRRWGSASTSAVGTVFYDSCKPDCAAGYHRARGSATLTAIRRCGRRLLYTRLVLVYRGRQRHTVQIATDCAGAITSVRGA
jgi:hypothetical protein